MDNCGENRKTKNETRRAFWFRFNPLPRMRKSLAGTICHPAPNRYENLLKIIYVKSSIKTSIFNSLHIVVAVDATARWDSLLFPFIYSTSMPDPIISVMFILSQLIAECGFYSNICRSAHSVATLKDFIEIQLFATFSNPKLMPEHVGSVLKWVFGFQKRNHILLLNLVIFGCKNPTFSPTTQERNAFDMHVFCSSFV